VSERQRHYLGDLIDDYLFDLAKVQEARDELRSREETADKSQRAVGEIMYKTGQRNVWHKGVNYLLNGNGDLRPTESPDAGKMRLVPPVKSATEVTWTPLGVLREPLVMAQGSPASIGPFGDDAPEGLGAGPLSGGVRTPSILGGSGNFPEPQTIEAAEFGHLDAIPPLEPAEAATASEEDEPATPDEGVVELDFRDTPRLADDPNKLTRLFRQQSPEATLRRD
jgi:hypothetical protein